MQATGTSDLAERVYELSDDEYVRLHLPADIDAENAQRVTDVEVLDRGTSQV